MQAAELSFKVQTGPKSRAGVLQKDLSKQIFKVHTSTFVLSSINLLIYSSGLFVSSQVISMCIFIYDKCLFAPLRKHFKLCVPSRSSGKQMKASISLELIDKCEKALRHDGKIKNCHMYIIAQ